jgi:hypothetical protein
MVPLDGSTLDGGAMGYIAGSHRFGVRKFVDIFSGEPEDLLAAPEVRSAEPIFVEVPRGGVAFHHGLTFHVAKPNRTPRTRRVHTVIFFRDGCTRASGGFHPSVDRAGIEAGQPIASSVTPIAWPRAAGDLPEPPPPARGATLGVATATPERRPMTGAWCATVSVRPANWNASGSSARFLRSRERATGVEDERIGSHEVRVS